MMPGRKYTQSGAYRYGFNGKEKAGEITSDDYDFGARIYDGRIGRWLSVDPLVKKFPHMSPYIGMDDDPISKIDPDGQSTKSTIVDEKGKVVGGSTQDRDLGVYKVSGVTKENFDINKLASYKSQGTKIGSTLSLNSFVIPDTKEWTGQINFNNRSSEKISEATKKFGTYLLSHTASQGFDQYKANAGNAGDYDIKAWGFEKFTGKTWLKASDEEKIRFVYQASFYDGNTIMTRRDQGNFFAGRAMKMTGTSEAVWLSGFGAYQSNGNKQGFMFKLKAGLNWIDQKIMGAATSGTPINGIKTTPIFHDDKVSEDLQRAGYNQFQR